jgi:AcrR family transcriptional regulator
MARTTGSFSDITGPKVRKEALQLFAEYGYAAVSMRQIAAKVGVKVGALYNYTPDKQTLLFDLMRSHMDELVQAFKAEPLGDDPVTRLKRFVRFHIQFHAARPEAVFIAYMELRNLSPENFAVIEGLRREYEGYLQKIILEGAQSGVFTCPEPRIASFAVIGMLKELHTWYRADGPLDLAAIEEVYIEMVSGAVSGRV